MLLTAVYLVLGAVLESISLILMTVPIVFPIVMAAGFDPVWFGIYLVLIVEIGLVTPPVGLNVFIASAATQTPTKVGFKGVAPFVAVELVLLALLVSFPEISLFLVN